MGKNAYFGLVTNSEGVFTQVFPPKEDGELIKIGEITAYLNSHGLNQYDIKELNRAINESEKETLVKVGAVGSIVSVNEKMEVSIYQDKMTATVRFYPPVKDGVLLTLQDILAELGAMGVKTGIDQESILAFLKDRAYGTTYTFARGRVPVEGHDARIEYYFNTDVNLKPRRNEDGTVNYKDLNTISHIEVGQEIAKLIKEDPGTPGINVMGEEIKPHSVKSLKLEYGNNITISEDKTTLYSNVTGHASILNGKVFVSDVFEVPADVDNSTGNIEYRGSVTVKGNVKSGFCVIAKGDIVVEGIVEDATLISDSQIIVKRGIHGMNKGELRAKGNIICKFIENAKIVSGGYVDSEAILHSQVDAFSEVRVNGKKGFITGGTIRAGNTIEAKTIGSEMETVTNLEVGVDPIQKERYVEIQKELANCHSNIDKIRPIILNYTGKIRKGAALTSEQLAYVRQLIAQMQNMQEKILPLNDEMARLSEIITLANSARVKVSKTIYGGVSITISDARMTLKDERNYSQFVREAGEIKVIPL